MKSDVMTDDSWGLIIMCIKNYYNNIVWNDYFEYLTVELELCTWPVCQNIMINNPQQ